MGLCLDRLCTDRTHPASLLAFPNYTDLHISSFKCLQKEKLILTDTWQMANGRLWLLNQHLCFGESTGKFFNVSV